MVDFVVPIPGVVLSGHFGTRFKKLGSGIIIYGSQNHQNLVIYANLAGLHDL